MVSKRQRGRRCKMELTKNIFFNTDKLIENSKVKISYTGKFYQDNSEKVFIHYGFGEDWSNVNEIEMENTELGFQTEIELLSGSTFNLCFRNGNGEWDTGDYAKGIQPEEVYYFPKVVEYKALWDVDQNWDIHATPVDKQKLDELKKQKPDEDKKKKERERDRNNQNRNRR